VTNNCNKNFLGGAAARIIRGSLAALTVLAVSSMVYAQEKAEDKREGISFRSIPSPVTSETITPPTGTSAFLLGHGVGTQAGSIDCLLLQVIGSDQGPAGGRSLTKTTFIQRLNTSGGSAPTVSCVVGQQALVPYSADYYFFRNDQ
jgi:Protein of unknown function (DUF3455)